MTEHSAQNLPVCDLTSDSTWRDWIAKLQDHGKFWAFSFNVSAWQGQEQFVADDAVQETALRILERSHRAACGKAPAIEQPERMLVATELNYLRDQRRRDLRLIRNVTDEHSFEAQIASYHQYVVDPAEMAIENVFQESLFFWVAHEIARFPKKERAALLYDLAIRMSFDEEPTPLQAAFLQEGIDLRDHVHTLPDDKKARTRHAALLWHAYKRLKEQILALYTQYDPAA